MRSKSLFLGILSLALVFNACIPLKSSNPTGELPTTAVKTIPASSVEGQACTEPAVLPIANGKVSYNNISFELDPALTTAVMAQSCPALPLSADQAPGKAHPPYTAFSFPDYNRDNTDYQPEVRVYEVAGDMTEYTAPLNMLPELQSILEERPDPVDWYRAPLKARQAYLDFANGSGVRGLVQYMQDFFFFTNNGLVYEYNGLTQDGGYFVSIRYPVSVPFLMELDGFALPPANLNPQAIAIPEWPSDFEQQRQVIEAYNTEALDRFEQMHDSDASPDLTLLDKLVQSIQIGTP